MESALGSLGVDASHSVRLAADDESFLGRGIKLLESWFIALFKQEAFGTDVLEWWFEQHAWLPTAASRRLDHALSKVRQPIAHDLYYYDIETTNYRLIIKKNFYGRDWICAVSCDLRSIHDIQGWLVQSLLDRTKIAYGRVNGAFIGDPAFHTRLQRLCEQASRSDSIVNGITDMNSNLKDAESRVYWDFEYFSMRAKNEWVVDVIGDSSHPWIFQRLPSTGMNGGITVTMMPDFSVKAFVFGKQVAASRVTSGQLGRRKVLNNNLVAFLSKMDKHRVCKGSGDAFTYYSKETVELLCPSYAAKLARRVANANGSGRSIVAAGLNRVGEADTLVEEWPGPNGEEEVHVLRSVHCPLLVEKKQRCAVCSNLSVLWSRRNDKAKERATGKRSSTSTTATVTSLQQSLDKEKKKAAAAKRKVERQRNDVGIQKRQMVQPQPPPPLGSESTQRLSDGHTRL